MQCTLVDDQFLNGAKVVRSLGEGSTTSVELVQVSSGRRYAIKQLEINPEGISSYVLKEADALILFRSVPEVIHLMGICQGPNSVSLIMEPMEIDLYYYIRATPFEVRMGLYDRLVTTLLQALNVFRSVDLVHYDIKSSNILIRGGEFKIGDFGFAERGTDIIRPPPLVYTSLYRPPEYVFERPRSTFQKYPGDIWATGITLIEYICGEFTCLYRGSTDVRKALYVSSTLAEIPFLDFALMNMMGTVQGQIRVKDLLTGQIDDDQVELLDLMLQLNPDDRSTAAQLLRQPVPPMVHPPAVARMADGFIDIIILMFRLMQASRFSALMAIELYTRYLGTPDLQRNGLAHLAAIRLTTEYIYNGVTYEELLTLYQEVYQVTATADQLKEAEAQLLKELEFNIFRTGLAEAYRRMGDLDLATVAVSEFAKPLDRWFLD